MLGRALPLTANADTGQYGVADRYVELDSRVVAWLRNLDDRCCNSGSTKWPVGDNFSTRRPEWSVPKVGIACAVRHPRKASVAVGSSRMLVKVMMNSNVCTKSTQFQERSPRSRYYVRSRWLCIVRAVLPGGKNMDARSVVDQGSCLETAFAPEKS